MIVHVLTLFPGLFDAFLKESIVGRAVSKQQLYVELVNFRDFAEGKHHVVDDRPFGGGPGMVLKPEPIFSAVEQAMSRAKYKNPKLILLSPQGKRFDQQKAIDLAGEEELIVLCGRYEGFDERILMGFPWDIISIGDYVLSGGEPAAMCLIESVIRLKPGVLGDEESAQRDSFMNGLLGTPQYTRPRSFRGMEVPEVLLSGDHQAIEQWRREEMKKRTKQKRPDLKDPDNTFRSD
ncbi:MAG: tRNA (guanosine(37)-N1)-methyltransferase TrmD [Planctomycetota bacterium]